MSGPGVCLLKGRQSAQEKWRRGVQKCKHSCCVQLNYLGYLHTVLSDGALLVGINVCMPGTESPSMIDSYVYEVRNYLKPDKRRI